MDDEDVFMDSERVVDDHLMGGHDAFVQIYSDGRIVVCETPVNTLPGFVVDGALEVVTLGVGGSFMLFVPLSLPPSNGNSN